MPVVLTCPQPNCDGWLEHEEESPVGPVYRCNKCGHGTLARRLTGITEVIAQAPHPQKGRSGRTGPDLEEELALQIKAAGLPEPERQFPLLEGRRFKGDFVWTRPPWTTRGPIVVEVQGKVHTIEEQWHRDCERLNLLMEAGYRVFFVTGRMIRSGDALRLLERVLI